MNKRYGSDLTEDAVNLSVIRPAPISLSVAEIGTPNVPAEVDHPIPVEAWVRFPEAAIHVRGEAVAWSDRAVWVEFTLHDGSTHRAWVWASAVDRIDGRRGSNANRRNDPSNGDATDRGRSR
ncbi:hypothetical protein J7E29_16785 [Streptomyces sp. ISL-90]|nr:hypothetical protein [Streptomyces sp. ISL-90]